MRDIITTVRFYTSEFGQVREAISFLSSIREVYNEIFVLFELPVQKIAWREGKYDLDDLSKRFTILANEELQLGAVQVSSPGFWEFAGNLNPLNFILGLIKLIMEQAEKKEQRRHSAIKSKIETISAYLDILDRYKERRWGTVTDPERFVEARFERIMEILEREVVKYISEGHSPEISEEEFHRHDRIELLRDYLENGSDIEKTSALRQLAALRDMESLPAIVARLGESGAIVREVAGELLPQFGESAVPMLIVILDDPNAKWDFQCEALGALSKIDTPVATKYILRALNDQHPNIRMEAAIAAGERKIVQAIPLLKEALSDNNKYVRKLAREALEKISVKGRT